MKKDAWYCLVCEKIIEEKERYVLLGTYENKKVIEERYFHIKCFSNWFNQRVNDKARKSMAQLQEKAMGMASSLKNLVGNIGGLDQVQKLLGLDLKKETKIDELEDYMLEKQKKNGKKRKK